MFPVYQHIIEGAISPKELTLLYSAFFFFFLLKL